MSDGMNLVILAGNVGADPEVRHTQSGQAVLNIRLATNKSWMKDGEKQERTDWHNVVMFGPRADGLGKILRKGSSVIVRGELRTSSYDGRDGEKRYRTDVYADDVLLTGGKPSGGETASAPRGRSGAARKTAARPAAPQQTGGDYDDSVPEGDDIPY